jgi:hypothetical protein
VHDFIGIDDFSDAPQSKNRVAVFHAFMLSYVRAAKPDAHVGTALLARE